MNDIKSIESRMLAVTFVLDFIKKKKLADKYAALIPVIESLTKRLDKINKLNLLNTPEGNAHIKRLIRRDLAIAAHHVSSGVYAYAQITGNASLKNAVNYSRSDFYRSLEKTMLARCRQVLNAARAIKNPCQFAITPLLIQKLESRITGYSDFMSVPKGKVKLHAHAMRQAKLLLNQCLSILQKQLDPLMVAIDCSEPKTLIGYNVMRQIKKAPGRKRKYVKSGKYATNKNKPVLKLRPAFTISSNAVAVAHI